LLENTGELFDSNYVYDRFEELSNSDRILFLSISGILLWALSRLFHSRNLKTGVAHVINRVHHHQGRLPFKNALFQFFGGALALIGGFSVGREGPAIHLGAWCSSAIGQYLKLPINGTRTLVACGASAAIAASFNTPLAGAMFAMEVIVMEYTVISGIPVILAAVIGAIASQSIYGNTIAFDVTAVKISGLSELALVAVMGFVCGTVSAFYNKLTLAFSYFESLALPLRILIAIFIMFAFSLVIPEVMGLGYDTINTVLLGQLSFGFLVALTIAKVVASGACLGLGLPGGLVGPTLFIGVSLGGAFGAFGSEYMELTTPASFFAIIGMVAVMGAVLQAPLAALITLLELTLNPYLLMPGMLAVVIACVTTKSVFGYKSMPVVILERNGITFAENPLDLALQKVAVTQAMQTSFVFLPSVASIQQVKNALMTNPLWVIILDKGQAPRRLMPAANLARYIDNLVASEPKRTQPKEEQDTNIELTEISAERLDLSSISYRESLFEASQNLNRKGVSALYVMDERHSSVEQSIIGVLTSENLRHYYRIN
jgi:CIC family chloride channel protein